MGLLVFIVTITLCLVVSSASLYHYYPSPRINGSLSFLVIGDWGRKGAYSQRKVANQQQGLLVFPLHLQFSISLQPSSKVLGNHDYRGDVETQLSPFLSDRDKKWLCQRSYIVSIEVADFFFVDTTPFVDEYFKEPICINYNWKGILPRAKYLDKLIKKHKVDVYMNGHDHSLQHISSKIQFMTSGGGSMALKGILPKWGLKELKFYYNGEGFMSVEITKNKFYPKTNLEIAFYDVDCKVLYKWNKSK
ncbi:unnamed protein product [Lupinus luteus]|uniref:Calcineurin-like phosphoesterase domain-containing protein n=1 Tax=Lupinus luteus TaxID=3873 RepID=A0AAV1Y9M9_LUPLU